MPISTKLKKFLDKNNVKYLTITHSRAFTAQEIAATMHCPGKELAKSVIVKVNGDYVMVVLPASDKIDFDEIKSALNADWVELASEEEFKGLFPECEVGAMPILGNIYGLPVIVSESILKDEDVYFNAGSHTEAIKMKTSDFKKLAKPRVEKLALSD